MSAEQTRDIVDSVVQDREFGPVLRRYRVGAGLTQEELAQRAGLSVRAVSDMERGRTWKPFLRSVRQLADALGLPPAERSLLIAAAEPESARPRWRCTSPTRSRPTSRMASSTCRPATPRIDLRARQSAGCPIWAVNPFHRSRRASLFGAIATVHEVHGSSAGSRDAVLRLRRAAADAATGNRGRGAPAARHLARCPSRAARPDSPRRPRRSPDTIALN
jgi:transcriptional regulator with XRE-family HTH domain